MTPSPDSPSPTPPAAPQHPRYDTATATCPEHSASRHTVDPSLPGVSFARVLRCELQKLIWLRATWWLSVSALVLVLLFAWFTAQSLTRWHQADLGTGPDEPSMSQMFIQDPLNGLTVTAILLGCLGVIAITSEHGTGSLRSSLAVVPRRALLYTAKALAVALVLAGLAAVMIAGILAVAMPFAAAVGQVPDFSSAQTWQLLLNHWGMVVLAGLLGFGLGALLRSTAGGIVTLAVVLFVLPIALEVLSGVAQDSELLMTLIRWQFSNLMASFTAPGPAQWYQDLDTFTAGIGLLAWTGITIVVGGLLFHRRDA